MLDLENAPPATGTPNSDAAGADSSPANAPTDAPAAPSPASDQRPNDDLNWGVSAADLGHPEPNPEPAPDIPDVHTATDPPAPRQGDQTAETDAGPTAAPEDAKSPAPAAPRDAKDDQFDRAGRINWDDDKVPFREEFQRLKEAYLASEGVRLTEQLVTEPAKFADWMQETSPTAYAELGAKLSTESADRYPDEWIDYIAQKNPDLLAAKVSGREGMTMERLRAELAVLTDEDDPDVQRKLEEQKAEGGKDAAAKPEETEEQKLIREFREEREAKARQEASNVVFAPIEKSVNALVSQAGLEVNLDEFAGKDLSALGEDDAFKVLVNRLIPVYIGIKADSDPRMKAMQARMEQLIAAKDANGLRALQHPAEIFATNATAEFLAIVTGHRAKAKSKEFTPPDPEKPKPLVRSAGAATGLTGTDDLSGPIDWSGDPSK